MRKIYSILIILVLSMRMHAQFGPYCASNSNSTNPDGESIGNVTFGVINNSTACNTFVGSQGTGIGLNSGSYTGYTNFTNTTVPVPILTFGATMPLSVNILQCQGGGWTNTAYAFFDWNQDFDFADAGESTQIYLGVGGAHTKSVNIIIPTTAKVGKTRMRIVCVETSFAASAPFIQGCGTYSWGETEDYDVFVGKKKWDFTIGGALAPDASGFCGDTLYAPLVKIKNIENQAITGGLLKYSIKGLSPSSTTSISGQKGFGDIVNSGDSVTIELDSMLFPQDELVEFTYVIKTIQDSNPLNDTFKQVVQVYKKPTFDLFSDQVCQGNETTIAVMNKSKPFFVHWQNESFLDTIKIIADTNAFIGKNYKYGIHISRGWKCNFDTFVNVSIFPNPIANIYSQQVLPTGSFRKDTVRVCAGGDIKFFNLIKKPGDAFKWQNFDKSFTSFVDSPVYTAPTDDNMRLTITNQYGCQTIQNVLIKSIIAPARNPFNDTICTGEMANVGLNAFTPEKFEYKWQSVVSDRNVIHPYPVSNTMYVCQWNYFGCYGRDTTFVKVNPIPNVNVTATSTAICPYFSSTITASLNAGSIPVTKYTWQGIGDTNKFTASPLNTSTYYLTTTGSNGCISKKPFTLYVYKQPDVVSYSNKYLDNVCNGDSVLIFVTGAKSYIWSTGKTDSVINTIPTESFNWNVIGTDGNGCKDTANFRMTLKPAPSLFVSDTFGCEGDKVKLRAWGGKSYTWGQYGNNATSTDIVLKASTGYYVTITSNEDCQLVLMGKTTVIPKPNARLNNVTVCQGFQAKLEASGGLSYKWSLGSSTVETLFYTPSSTEDVTVTVYSGDNLKGCASEVTSTIEVIEPDSIEFRSPLDLYKCPSQQIPVTLLALPQGGVWSSPGGSLSITGNKWTIPWTMAGTQTITYSYLNPINGCITKKNKTVEVSRNCKSGINGAIDDEIWSVYPNPFVDNLSVKVISDKNENCIIKLYDISGREVYQVEHKLSSGENIISLNQLELSKGSYYLELQTEKVSRKQKIIRE